MSENDILLKLYEDGKIDELPPSLKMRLGYILLDKAKKPDNEKDADTLKIEMEKDDNPHSLLVKGFAERIEKDDNLNRDDD